MERSLKEYRRAIQEGGVNPLRRWDGRSSGLLFDPADPQVPLTLMSFGAYNLNAGAARGHTGANEGVLIPVTGQVTVKTEKAALSSSREGGPFAVLPDSSNASAIYLPRNCRYEIEGRGELAAFWGPARGDKPPALVAVGDRENLVRGSGTWRRDVMTLATPDDVTTNLVVGETYSPPSLWSGTPLHVHDLDDPAGGQSDHEEVYYHLARVTEGRWGAYGVQLLFDDAGLDKAYVIHNRDAFAIPGAAHPVVAGPMSDMLYLWGLGGRPDASPSLGMKDIEEFAYLKKVAGIIDRLTARHARPSIDAAQLAQLAEEAGLDDRGRRMLAMHLRQCGFAAEFPR